MNKIEFVNNQAPALSAENLNQMQDNMEDAFLNEQSNSTTDGYSANYINNLNKIINITSKITKTANVGTIYLLEAYQKGSRCYLNAQFDINNSGNIFTLDNSILPKYTEISIAENYSTAGAFPVIVKATNNNTNISVDIFGTRLSYCAFHLEWEI